MYRIGGETRRRDAHSFEVDVGIPPCASGALTWSIDRESARRGRLTGAVASHKSNGERPKGTLRLDGNSRRVQMRACLTVRATTRTGTKVGISESAVPEWKGRAQRDKSYPWDNRTDLAKSSHRRRGLAPRCRLHRTPGAGFGSKGWGCPPIKAVLRSWVQTS